MTMRHRSRVLLAVLLFSAGLASACSDSVESAEQITVAREGGHMVLTSSAQGRADVSAEFIPAGAPPLVHFSAFSWPGRNVSDAYLYGLAPANATSFETTPAGTAKIEPDGTFLAVLPNMATAPPQSIHWRFLSADGSLLDEGNGPNT